MVCAEKTIQILKSLILIMYCFCGTWSGSFFCFVLIACKCVITKSMKNGQAMPGRYEFTVKTDYSSSSASISASISSDISLYVLLRFFRNSIEVGRSCS